MCNQRREMRVHGSPGRARARRAPGSDAGRDSTRPANPPMMVITTPRSATHTPHPTPHRRCSHPHMTGLKGRGTAAVIGDPGHDPQSGSDVLVVGTAVGAGRVDDVDDAGGCEAELVHAANIRARTTMATTPSLRTVRLNPSGGAGHVTTTCGNPREHPKVCQQRCFPQSTPARILGTRKDVRLAA